LENKDNLDTKLLLIERLKEVKSNLNKGKKEFLVHNGHLNSIDPNYVSGFCNGDGSTTLVTSPETFHKGFGSATLSIGQHINNLPLLEAIKEHLSIGNIFTHKDVALFTIGNKEDLNNIIIPGAV